MKSKHILVYISYIHTNLQEVINNTFLVQYFPLSKECPTLNEPNRIYEILLGVHKYGKAKK